MDELLTKAEAFVRDRTARFPATLQYHNAAHMAEVAQAAKELAHEAALEKADALALRLAAWFHDVAYDQGAAGHEQRGADIAAEFLRSENADPALIARVQALVLATRVDAPTNEPLADLIRDADIVHIARPSHLDQIERLRQEQEATQGVHVKKKAWLADNLEFLERTQFRSAAARVLWNDGRLRNLTAMRDSLKAQDDRKQEEEQAKAEKKAAKQRRERTKETERGVETMFRVTLSNHTRLSQIADNKANIMLTVNALMISLMLGGPMTKVDKHPEYLMPLGLVLLTSAICIVTATLATRPTVTHGRTTKEEIKRKEANLLFFGNFHDMPLADYQEGMRDLMEDREYLYGTLTKDLHSLGKVLHRKYRFLRITYTIFMLGVVSAVVLVLFMASRGSDFPLM